MEINMKSVEEFNIGGLYKFSFYTGFPSKKLPFINEIYFLHKIKNGTYFFFNLTTKQDNYNWTLNSLESIILDNRVSIL